MKIISIRDGASFALRYLLVAGFLIFGEMNSVFAFDQPWNGGREDITRPEPDDDDDDCKSGDCKCPNDNNTRSPVYAAKGYLVWQEVDIETPTNDLLSIHRTYNSFDMRAGMFGRGWMSAQERGIARTFQALTEGNPDGSSRPAEEYASVPIWLAEYGRRYRLEETETSCKTPEVLSFTFEKTLEGGFRQVFDNSLDFNVYDSSGRLLKSYKNSLGSTIYYHYDDQGRLIKQVDGFGFALTFSYNEQGFVKSAEDSASRVWSYEYDESGLLTKVISPDLTSTQYEYLSIDKIGYKRYYLSKVTVDENEVVLQVGWKEIKLFEKSAHRVESYSLNERYKHDYTYAKVTVAGRDLVKVSKKTYQVGSTALLSHLEAYVDPLTYRVENQTEHVRSVSLSTTYDNRGNVTQRVDERGNIFDFSYDDKGRLITYRELVDSADERVTSITYRGDSDRPTSVTEENRLQTTYEYDDYLRMVLRSEQDLVTGEIRTWRYKYHPNTQDSEGGVLLGKVAEEDGPLRSQDVSKFAYNTNGLLKKVTHPNGLSTSYEYDGAGNVLLEAAMNAVPHQYAYDAQNHLTRNTRLDEIDSYTYNGRGLMTSLSKDGTGEVLFEYYPSGDLARAQYPSGRYETYERQSDGTVIESSFTGNDGLVFKNLRKHHPLDDSIVTAEYLSSTAQLATQLSYSGSYDLTEIKRFGTFNGSAASSSTLFENDLEGRPLRITDAGEEISFGYDAFGRVTEILDAAGATSEYEYNAWDELIGVRSKDTGNQLFTYDEHGNISSINTSDGRSASFNYDSMGRLTFVDYPGIGDDVSLIYDEGEFGGGRLTAASDASGITSISYDPQDRVSSVESEVLGSQFRTTYSYDQSGLLSAMTYPSGLSLLFEYDPDGRLTHIGKQGQTGGLDDASILSINWNASLIAEETTGNGVTTQYHYDTAGRLVGKDFGAINRSVTVTLDLQGQVVSETVVADAVRAPTTYQYDLKGRLKSEVLPTVRAISYGYDAGGNRTSRVDGVTSTSTAYSYEQNSNRISGIDGRTTLLDDDGNLISDGLNAYTYNSAGQLRSVNGITEYVYNYLDMRAAKISAGVVTKFVYGQQGELIGEYDSSGLRIREYVYKQSGEILELVAVVDAEGELYYVHTDNIYSPRFVSDGSQDVVWSLNADAFGDGLADEDVDQDGEIFRLNHRFPGQYFDAESGLHYNYYRYYSPSLGRYLSADPVGLADGPNPFLYAENSPKVYYDSDGRAIWVPVVIIGTRIAIAGWKAYKQLQKARKALAKTCSSIHAGYHVVCDTTPSCKSTTDCETIKNRLKGRKACVDGRKLYISLNCDGVGRGYGARGKSTPSHLAKQDRERHKNELENAKNALNECIKRKVQYCKDCP